MNKSFFQNLLSPVLFLILWEITSRSGFFDPFILPPFSAVLFGLIQLFLSGEIYPHIAISLLRIFFGFGLAAIIAIPMGLLIGRSKAIEKSINPLIEMLRPISPIALFPVFMLWFGIGLLSKVAIIFWVCWFPLLLNTIKGVKSVDPNLIKAAKSMNASDFEIFKNVIIPSSTFWIITGLRISVASSLLALIAAEMVGANSGIGFFILTSAYTFKIVNMYAGIIIIGLTGFILNYFFLRLEKSLTKWNN